MKYIATISILYAILTSCTPYEPCGKVLPPPNSFEMRLVDTAGNNLIGTVYVQDSFKLFNGNKTIYIRSTPFGDPSLLQVFYPNIESGKDYYLELDGSDTDTMNVIYSVEHGKCFDSYDILSFSYNGHPFPVSAQYTITK